MPYLQVDVPGSYPVARKRAFAQRLAEVYARVMETDVRIPAVGVRELGAENLYRFEQGEARNVVVVMCDIRRGRPVDQRERFAREIVALCATTFDVDERHVVVEFTQHSADEMFRYGQLAPQWSADEAAPNADNTTLRDP